MREVANRLVKDKAIFEKADVYALRDVVAAEILGPDWAQRNKQAEDKEPGNETTAAMVEEPAKTSTKKQKPKAAKTDKPKVSAKDKDNKNEKRKTTMKTMTKTNLRHRRKTRAQNKWQYTQ